MALKRGLFTIEKKQQKQQSNTSRLLRKDKLSKYVLILLVMGYDKIKFVFSKHMTTFSLDRHPKPLIWAMM